MNPDKMAPVRVNPVLCHPDEQRVSLSGEWGLRLDPDDRGIRERWFETPVMFAEPVTVPGSWQGQGFGGDGKDTVMDFRLQARTYRATYKGTGWYGKTFRLPPEWEGRRVCLNFGGVHPTAEVWLNGRQLGESHAPFVPFGFDVTNAVRFSEGNALVVRVSDQDRDLGFLYNFPGNWSGIYRDVELTATGTARLERFWVYPEPDEARIRFTVRTDRADAPAGSLALHVTVTPPRDANAAAPTPIKAVYTLDSDEAEFRLAVPTPRLWSPDTPHLYRVDAVLRHDGEVADAVSERVGFVTLTPKGRQFLINGGPYYMRGHGDFDFPPERGCPDTDRERWRKKLSALRAYGYNHVRCQSFVPTPEYLDVADEVGLLVQSEMGSVGAWGGHSQWHGYNWPEPIPTYREKLRRQWNRIVARDVNHPCANLYCMSNERWTGFTWPRTAWQCYHETKAVKPSALVIWTDGGADENLPQDFVNCTERMDETCSDKPIIRHEYKWWSSFPDVTQMHRFTGGLRPFAADIALEAAARHGIAHTLPAAARNSQRLQFIEAKGNMEACRRDCPDLAGISHFSAVDTVPSPQGIIDAFYERKYAAAETWRRTNGDTVVLSSLGFDDRVLASGETFACELFVSDFSHPAFREPVIEWALVKGDVEVATGTVAYAHTPHTTCRVGQLEARVPDVAVPVKGALRVVLREGERRVDNEWDLWFFPESAGLPGSVAVHGGPEHTWLTTLSGVPTVAAVDAGDGASPRCLLAERFEEALIRFMRAGGRVLLAASEPLLFQFTPKLGLGTGRYFFTPPAQYPPLENGHNGTIIADHPVLGDLPHEGFADLQFYRMMAESAALELIPLGLNANDPVIRVMHSYPIGRSLGYLVERGVGAGGLVLCALDLNQSWCEARYLLAQMLRHMGSDAFSPELPLDDDGLRRLVDLARLP